MNSMDDWFDGETPEAKEDESTAIGRRSFVKLAVAAATAGSLGTTAAAQEAPPTRDQRPPKPPLPPLGNGEPPAIEFQAYPGGTGAYLEKLAKERGRTSFERAKFNVEPWKGAVPNSEEEIAFLPV